MVETQENGVAPMSKDDLAFRALAVRCGPHAVQFAEWLAGTFWQRAQTTALDMGFDGSEAAYIARCAAAGAAKAMASAVEATHQARQFRRPH